MKNFRTYELAVEFYKIAQNIKVPRHLRDQLDRASSSIVLNLAEGSARRTKIDQRKFYNISFASTRECEAILDLGLVGSREVRNSLDSLAAHLYRLIEKTG